MSYPTGNTKREQNFLDGIRGVTGTPEDYERYLHTYRVLGNKLAWEQVKAESRLHHINYKLKVKEAEANG
ncbi:hypothetical protein [Bacillus toyonensis]|uniref:hypothetical protein n=1 Tax=Bacillus toyonensis TaxID=155322 RepID=UPI000BEFAABA|nr:hypothetical protein [Bacillus toyonensis]KAB2380173.1 hypothetical protein F8507_27190 [Bacillus toyonensis]PEM64422.1 hypothetical protein CN625_01545 [Bacillus toyonensis]